MEPLDVYARDCWQCGICGEAVDDQLDYPDPMCASLDHIIPMALGGGHTYANTQCSHSICNSIKSARVTTANIANAAAKVIDQLSKAAGRDTTAA